MANLRAILARESSRKTYPDINDASVQEAIIRGRVDFGTAYLGKSYPWVLGGVCGTPGVMCESEKGLWYETRNPDEGMLVGTFLRFPGPAWTPESVMKLLWNVRIAGLNFSKEINWEQRILLLLEISNVMRERFWIFVAALQYETGQSIMEAIGETDEAVDFPRVVAMYLQELHADLLLPSPAFAGDYNGKRYVPHGVFLDISPFNFPAAIPMDMACKALAMGNAFIEKSSDKSSLCGFLVYESILIAFRALGLHQHEEVVNYIPGGPDVVDTLLQSPNIAGISFTGSSAALSSIKEKHGTMLREQYRGRAPLRLGSTETSGVNVVVVWRGVNTRYAAKECLKSFVGRQGQKCSSARVIMVHKDVRDAFVTNLVAELRSLRFGNVLDGADTGKVITPEAERRISKTVKELKYTHVVDEIFSFTLDETELSAPRILFASQDVLEDDRKAACLMNTEIFGPVVTIVVVWNLTDIERLCHFSDFALTGSYFCENMDVCCALDEIIPAGNLYHNRKCTGALVESECFGGLSSLSGTGIKGKQALPLFASMQVCSGMYGRTWSVKKRAEFIKRKQARGVVFSKT